MTPEAEGTQTMATSELVHSDTTTILNWDHDLLAAFEQR
jgi:hypothetical protein